MKRFEKDIEDGKDVTLEDYTVPTSKDYTTRLTKGTNKVSIGVNKVLKKGIEGVFKVLGNFVKEWCLIKKKHFYLVVSFLFLYYN